MAIRLNVGRQNVTKVLSPAQSGYVQSMREQMNIIKKNLERVIEGVEAATPAALRFGLTPMFNTSQMLTPKKTGKLRRSGFLEARRTTRGATAAIGYGRGGNPFYAPIVHERIDIPHAAPTQAKFLEEAVNRHIGNFPRRVREFLRQETGIK